MASVIYGDGTHSVEVHDDIGKVMLTDARSATVIVLSTAAFEEVVLGWQRHQVKPGVIHELSGTSESGMGAEA